jgi:hypothetical protein
VANVNLYCCFADYELFRDRAIRKTFSEELLNLDFSARQALRVTASRGT